MIKEKSIREVQDLDLFTVVNKYVPGLKKAGVNYVAPCPWHNERSASFTLSPVKEIVKCFGCGRGAAGAVGFLMELRGIDWIEAIEELATEFNIELEREADTRTVAEKEKERDEKKEVSGIMRATVNHFSKELFSQGSKAYSYLMRRGITDETAILWKIGYAPEGGRFLTPMIIEKGLWAPAEKLGLVRNKNERNYDFFQDRLMFPIHNRNGEPIAFGGRTLSDDKTQAKYLNSPESAYYNKSDVLYGYHLAAESIRKNRNAYLVEGYMDVIGMHEGGLTNTVGSCGTAFTLDHAKRLKKLTNTVTLVGDGDKAGFAANLKAVNIFLSAGLIVNLLLLPDGHDPDSFMKQHLPVYSPKAISNWFEAETQDAVLFKAKHIWEQATSVPAKAAATKEIGELLNSIGDSTTRIGYIEPVSKATGKGGLGVAALKLKVKAEQKEEKKVNQVIRLSDDEQDFLPEWAEPHRKHVMTYGFLGRDEGNKTGYYFAPEWTKPATNFIIKPLFHLYGNDNKRLFMVKNGHTDWKVVEVESKDFISPDKMLATLFQEGHFYAQGTYTKHHHMKLVSMIGNLFPLCYEINEMGWQPEGFFAFSNAVFTDKIENYSDIGVVEVGEKHYFMPVSGDLRQDYRAGDDIYENDRYLKFVETDLKFAEWATLMRKVYKEASYTAVAFALMTAFKDVVMKATKIPLLYAYGPVGSGKSEYGESITYLFFSGKDADGNLIKPFNLNQGTEYAFFSRVGRYKNCPAALNEFDEDKIDEVRFRAIKGSWDGEGRERGTGKKNKSETQKINTTVILMGQFLSTKDDASVLSRSVPESFLPNNDRTPEEIADFRILKNWERKGLSGILPEILQHRPAVMEGFSKRYAECSDRMAAEIEASNQKYVLRILKNYSVFTAMVELLAEPLNLPFQPDEFWAICKRKIVELSSLMEESNALADFWNTMVYLLDVRREISEGWDFAIEPQLSFSLGEQRWNWKEPKRLLYVRLNSVHKLFAEQYRREKGQTAINAKTIEHFFKASPAYLGNMPSKYFRHPSKGEASTSCHVFDYDLLNVNLDRTSHEQGILTELTARVQYEGKLEEINGVVSVRWQMVEEMQTTINGLPGTKKTVTYCFGRKSEWAELVKPGNVLKLKGYLKENLQTDKNTGGQILRRNLDVDKLELVASMPPNAGQTSAILPGDNNLPF